MLKFVNKKRSEEAARFTILETKRAEPPTQQRRSQRTAQEAEKPTYEEVEEVEESTRKRRKLPVIEEGPLKRRKLTGAELLAEPVVAGLMTKLNTVVGVIATAL